MIMSLTFTISYVALVLLVTAEAIVLRQVLRKTAWLRKFYMGFKPASEDRLAGGSIAPEFRVRILDSNETASNEQLRGHETVLIFVSPGEASSPGYRNLNVALDALWHDTEGHLHLVCTGNEEPCRQLARDAQAEKHRIAVLLDEEGKMARDFLVTNTPLGLRFDEDCRLIRYGQPNIEVEEESKADAGITGDFTRNMGPSYSAVGPAWHNGVNHG
jgi:hypothetical protein